MLTITCQEIFNKAWQAFVIENRPPSINNGGICLYRGVNDTRCAIGLCIPDEYYDLKMEGCGTTDLTEWFPIEFDNEVTASEIQAALHDQIKNLLGSESYSDRETVEEIYRDFAKEHGLDIPQNVE